MHGALPRRATAEVKLGSCELMHLLSRDSGSGREVAHMNPK